MKEKLQCAALAIAVMFIVGLMTIPNIIDTIKSSSQFNNTEYTQKLQITIDSKTVDLYVVSSHKLNCEKWEGSNNGIKCYWFK